MENKVLQGTPQWLEAKKAKIGASEIYTLCFHYCRPELEKLGLNVIKVTERPFRTIQELFLKIKFGAELSSIDPICSEFGNSMESYVAYRLGRAEPKITIERTKDFIINEELHPLAACSPDGYLTFPPFDRHANSSTKFRLPDFDNTCEIDESWGVGALELKTANYFANFGAEEGAKLAYIFQLTYQMMITGLGWGALAMITPKQKEYDEPFFKGRILGSFELRQSMTSDEEVYSYEDIDKYYDLHYYVYPRLPAFEEIIMKALRNFQADLDAYSSGVEKAFPRNSEDLAGLQREKAMWAQLWPDKFGKLQLTQEEELNFLLNQRHEANVACMFAEGEKKKLENEIVQRVGKYQEVIGTEQRLIWTKNGQVRFYKLK